MYKLLPLELYSRYIFDVLELITEYKKLLFSDMENPYEVFTDTFLNNKIKVIVATENDNFFAFLVLYNFRKISSDTFSCYIYGASKRKKTSALNKLFPFVIDDLKTKGCKVVRCETRDYNMPMRLFAKRFGFRKVGVLKQASFSCNRFVDNILYEKILE